MSYDFKVIQACDHSFFDYYSLGEDNALRIPWPALNGVTCKVFFNGQVVPENNYYFRNAKFNEIDYTLVIFRHYQRTLNARYRVRVTALREACPKCNRTGVSVQLTAHKGGVIDVLNSNRNEHLYQQFLLFLKTAEGSDPFYPRYGSRLSKLVGRSGASSQVAAEVQRVHQQWIRIRQAYDQLIGNTSQTYFDIANTTLYVDPADPRRSQVTVALTTEGRRLTLSV